MKKRIIVLLLAIIALVVYLAVPIGATVAEPQTETETFWDKYPFFNILPFTWQNIAGEHNGVTITVEDDGTIRAVGTINAPGENVNRPGEMLVNYYDIVLYEGEGIELPEVVTLSSNDVTRRSYLYFYLDNSERINLNWEEDSNTFNTDGSKLIKLVLRLRVEDDPMDLTIKLMLNAGSVKYPWQPYSLKDELIGEGYEAGYTEGHNEGYNKAWQGGYNGGYNNGYVKGNSEGYVRGNSEGYSQGKAEGYNEGKAEGLNIGIKQGEQSTVVSGFKGLVNDIANTPFLALDGMFDFKIFDIDIAGAIFTIFTIIVIACVIGFFVKMIL